jgi:hypothetical protein
VTATVAVESDDPSALARMLAELIEINLRRHPERSQLLRPATIELEAIDAGVVATVHVRPDLVEVRGGRANPRFDLRIRAASRDLLELSSAPLRMGFPDPLRRAGRMVLGDVIRGRVRIAGMLAHPIVLSRFARLLSVA